jgi:molybdenum cofactor cytidylyltransferase
MSAFAENCNVIAAIILAAGRSSRMGTSKALLAASPTETFVSRLLATLRDGGIANRFVVGRPDDDLLRREVEGHGAAFVTNPDADAGGQLSSLLAGLAAADRADLRGLMSVPVDAPLVSPATVATLLAVFDATLAPVVRPRHAGRHGHPVIFSRGVFDELRRADPAAGAKAVLRAHQAAIVNVDVEDAGVLGDVDTPESYRALFGRDP